MVLAMSMLQFVLSIAHKSAYHHVQTIIQKHYVCKWLLNNVTLIWDKVAAILLQAMNINYQIVHQLLINAMLV